MNADDKITRIDEMPINQALARRALPVLVGVLCQPEAVDAVDEEIGQWLALPKRGIDYRGDAFTRTLWAAISELREGSRPLHPVTVAQQIEVITARRTKGLLDAWTPEHAERFTTALREHAVHMHTPSVVVDLARDWSREAVKLCELGPAAAQLSKAMAEGSPVDIAEALDSMKQISARCAPHSDVPIGNLAERGRGWRERKTVQKIASGYVDLDAAGGGLDYGLSGIGGRTGDGKTALMLNLAVAQVFPNAASYELRETPAERIKPRLDAARPYVLFLSVEMAFDLLYTRLVASMMRLDNGALLREDKELELLRSTVAYDEVLAAFETHGRFTVLDSEDIGALSAQAVCNTIGSWATRVREQDPDATCVVFTDYLQFLDRDPTRESYEEVDKAARMLLRVSNEHKLVSFVGLQCADAPSGKTPHETSRNDIRASKGVIEHMASVLLVRRHADDATRFTVHNAKQRNGPPLWTIDLHFEGNYGALTNRPAELVQAAPSAVLPFEELDAVWGKR